MVKSGSIIMSEKGPSGSSISDVTEAQRKRRQKEIKTKFDEEVALVDLDRMTIDDMLIEHPNLIEPDVIKGLEKLKSEEAKKPKKP